MRYVIIILFTFLSININATTYCIQEFNMIGLDTSNVPILYISETLSGECQLPLLHKITLNDSSVKYKEIRYDVEKSLEHTRDIVINRIKKRIKNKDEKPIVFLKKDGLWKCLNSDILIKEPKFSLELEEKLNKEMIIFSGDWNRKHGKEGIVSPGFLNTKVELINYHLGGFYVDYNIEKIYYFKNAGYFLVFTHQSRSGPSMDSMHGYLLYKLK
jgi:hypothetical protein